MAPELSIADLKWLVAHDPCRAGDRSPAGAVPAGTAVRVRLHVDASARPLVHGADLLWKRFGDREPAWHEAPLRADGGCLQGEVPPAGEPQVVFYAFRLTLEAGALAYYVPCADGRSTAGELVVPGADGEWEAAGWAYSPDRLRARPMGGFGLAAPAPGFQVTSYDPAFSAPAWLQGAVMYQVFPDRFARGAGGVREEGLAYHAQMNRPVHLHRNWDEPVEWLGDADGGAAEGDLAARMAAYDPVDFYGGTLAGIREQLPYLASLGVEVLYLNPVFEARSNHRYDTADYRRIDPLLGDGDDFRALAEEAREAGISIVLDAVLSHTGDDSRYFNARGTYGEPGAMQGDASPYRPWFDFTPQENGVPYRCWWGDRTLPEVNERDASWQEYMMGRDGALRAWLAAGARGYRLDVADEIPDDVLSRIRACVKDADPQAAIIGEVWEDPTTKESYGAPRDYALGHALDSVMNYPLRDALLGFAMGRIDAHQLAAFLKAQQANYPAPLYGCLMNLLSSHDVERVRSVLAAGGPLKHLTRDAQVRAAAAIAPDQDERAARLQRMVAGVLYALPGAPCLYYGDERGLQGGGDPFCRATFPWGAAVERADCGEDLTACYRELGQMRRGSHVLRQGALACCAPHEDVLLIARHLPDGTCAFALANRASEDIRIACDLRDPALGLPAVPGDGILEAAAPALTTRFLLSGNGPCG